MALSYDDSTINIVVIIIIIIINSSKTQYLRDSDTPISGGGIKRLCTYGVMRPSGARVLMMVCLA